MRSLSMDLDYLKYFNLNDEDIVDELNRLKGKNVTSLIIPYEILLNKDLIEFKNKIFRCLSIVKFDLIFRAQSIRNYSATYTDDKTIEESVNCHKQFIFNLQEELSSLNIANKFKVIFQGGVCRGTDINIFYEKAFYFFNELAIATEKIDVDILIELTQIDYKMGRLIGNLWKDMKYLTDRIRLDNFGICWNMKSSRVNREEYGDDLIPQKELLDRVKVCIITNQNAYDSRKPFNVEMQFEEIKALVLNDYNDVYHLEYIYSYLEENNIPYDNVYDSVDYLNYIITYYENEKIKDTLELNEDFEKMKRKTIRRTFNEDVMCFIENINYKFNEIEISEQDLKISCSYKFDLNDMTNYTLVLKVKDYMLELAIGLITIRERLNEENNIIYDYIFKIKSEDRITKKKLLELIYLSK